MRLTDRDYESLYEIAPDLDLTNLEDIQDFANDCQMVGAKKTSKYVKDQIKAESDPALSMINYWLSVDASGC